MKIIGVRANGRRRAFEVRTARRTYFFPFNQSDPAPSGADPVVEVRPDPELGNEGFTYRLRSGQEGTIHVESVLEVNEDPKYMADLLVYKLSLEAARRMEESGRTARDVAQELGTSPAQLYRLLDPTNYSKSIRQLATLLNILGYQIDVQVNAIPRGGQRRAGASRRLTRTT
ncbi:MAG: hypothetical protein ACRDVC_01800 [Acidimicrobiales bacterium]